MSHSMKSRTALAVTLGLALGVLGPIPTALAQTSAPVRAPVPDPAMEAAQRAFEALTEAERKAIQDDLIWGSDFTATISGGFGKRTYDSILAFERATKQKVDGILDIAERKLLGDAASKARVAAKFGVVIDAKTGASLGIPATALSKREALPGGSRWSSADGSLVLETAVAAGGAPELPAAFERLLAAPVPGKKITYKLLRPDFFVVSGEIGPRSFYTRYGIGKTSLSGYTFTWPTVRSKEQERNLIALANSFQPVAGSAPVQAALVTQPPPAPPAQDSLPPGQFLSGIVVAPGKVVTLTLAEACTELTVNRKPARVSTSDKPGGLAIIDTDTGNAKPAILGNAPASGNVFVIGFGTSGQTVSLGIAPGHLLTLNTRVQRLEAPLGRESGGSAIFDRSGALTGLVGNSARTPRLVAGLVPVISHPVIPATTLAKLAGVPTPGTSSGKDLTAGAIVAATGSSILPVECRVAVPLPKN